MLLLGRRIKETFGGGKCSEPRQRITFRAPTPIPALYSTSISFNNMEREAHEAPNWKCSYILTQMVENRRGDIKYARRNSASPVPTNCSPNF